MLAKQLFLLLTTMSTREARKPKTSCQPCYQRKVWCDGKTPCGSCSHSRKALVCEYQTVSVQVDLPKGSACIPCR
ncbi:hypothetical protein C8R46DRAFT_377891 [Mycena filopes]|nr:hypothetical protein C8R46DRAFT_377891 [Mycena filopes]